jgi:flagellar hook-basal body complex protein FliE
LKITPQTNPLGPNFRQVRQVGSGPEAGGDFLSFLQGKIKEVDLLQHEADAAASGLALGKVGIQEAMVAVQKADISFRLLMQVRNKAIEAYREVIHMQL